MIGLPKTQAQNSATYRLPPLEERAFTLPELYEWHATHSPKHPFFVFDDGDRKSKTILWEEAIRAIHRAAHLAKSYVDADSKRPIVAILAASDTITYLCLMMGVIYAGFAVFPISPRNSPEAVSHLLSKTNSTHLIVSGENSIRTLATSALASLRSDVKVCYMPCHEDLFPPNAGVKDYKRFSPGSLDVNDTALILHSSGSTAFPKPIRWSHTGLFRLGKAPFYGDLDLCGLILGCHSVPMFHGMGVFQILLVATCGVVMSVFKPTAPATVPTPTNVFEESLATDTELIGCVPMFIEEWSRDPVKVDAMKKMKGVMYGGGPLNKAIGDSLASNGVTIYVTYACTECGPVSTFLRKNPGMDWEYFSFSGHTRPEMLPYADGIVEVVMKSHEGHTPSVLNTTVAREDGYATNDLLVPHPTDPNLWKVFGRADDQIMLSTGEKTNPGPLETILSQDVHIRAAVIFGRGRFQNGVIVEPTPEFAFDPSDEQMLAEFRRSVWPTIEKTNSFAPTHSRLFKEMIIVASPRKPFTYTAKGTVRRPAVIADYDEEINHLYNTVALSTQTNVASPLDWSMAQTKRFIRTVLTNVLTNSVDDDADLFQNGCDSLQATWIRNSILRALRETMGADVAGRVPENIVYQFPTVSSLASFVSASMVDVPRTDDVQMSEKINEVQLMVKKYSSDFLVRLTDQYTTQKGVGHLLTLDDVHSVHQGVPRSRFIRAFTVDLPLLITRYGSRFKSPSTNAHAALPSSVTVPSSQKPNFASKRGHSRNFSLPVKLSFTANRSSEKKTPKRDVVLVTGTTGGFGANVLYHLAMSDDVSKIFALNRKSPDGTSLASKQRTALQLAFDDVDMQWLAEITLLEGDLTTPGLGLDTEVYKEICRSVTHIIHIAWRVDFNLSLPSFESNICGLKNLIDLALLSPKPSPPRFIFISSIGVVQNTPHGGLVPEAPISDPRIAIATGYTESKYVAEQVIAEAARDTSLKPIIVRLGQVAGHRSGYWNEREWFPSLVKSGVTLQCLPNLDGNVSWIPSYEAAKALTEMRDAEYPVLHLAHPRPVPWSSLIEPIARSLCVPLVPYPQWLSALESSLIDTSISEVQHMHRNPALRLLKFFQTVNLDKDKEPLGVSGLATDKATQVSPTLNSGLKELGVEDVNKWMEGWRRTAFI